MSRTGPTRTGIESKPSTRTRWIRLRVTLSVLVASTAFGLTIPSLVIATSAAADTLQMSSDNFDTSWYPNEPQLAPSAVTGGDFGQLFNTQLTGQVYAQPLVAQPTVLAVTEKDYAYGLNSTTGAIVWSKDFGTPADPLAQTGCGDIGANMGITGTPVIDPATDVAYFVAATGTGAGGATQYFMDAVNVQTGTTPTGWPAGGVPIQGAADNDPGTVFNGQWQTQRPGLVLVNGVVYAAFGSQCDFGSWNGWLIGVSESSATITTMWASETGQFGGGHGGIWQSGSAPVVDSQGNIYFSTGNGTLPSPGPGTNTSVTALGQAVVKLSTTGGKLHVADWFVPANAAALNVYDADVGAGGTVALPPSMGTSQEPNVLLQTSKDGVLYALNMDSLGGYQQGPGGTDAVPFETTSVGSVWSKPAVWPGDGGYVYVPTAGSASSTYQNTAGGSLNAYQRVVSTSGAVTFQLVGATSNSGTTFGFGSGKPIVTSDGTTSGSALLWITHTSDSSGAGAELQAYDPIPRNPGPQGTLTEVWHASIGTAAKFSEPAVDNGIIYVGARNSTSDGALIGFGFLATPTLTGANVSFSPMIVSQSTTSTATFTATASTTVSSFTPTGAAFSIGTPSLSLPAALSAGQTITVPVTFTPNAIGTLSGTLTANNTGPTAVVTLSGQGLSASSLLSASPPSADFTIQPIGGPVVSMIVTFTNVSANPIDVTGFTAPALPFAVSDPPGITALNPGDTLRFTVNFSPPGSSGDFVHAFNSVTTLITNDGNFGVPVSGSAAPLAQINIVPTSLSFGDVQVGSSATLTFDVGNQGGLPLTITTSTPPATNGFTNVTNPVNLTSGALFAANASVKESVRFTPTTTGLVSSTWTIEGNDGSGLQTVTMTGTGISTSPTPPPPSPPSPPPSSGGSSSPPPPSVQSTLAITSLSGYVGTALALATSGDTGGVVTFSVSNGSVAGCAISGSSLTVTSAGTCVVTATRAANGNSSAVSSPATTITFAPKVSTASPVAVTVSFTATSYVLSAEAKKTLRALALRLVTGTSVTITGFAKGDAVLAKGRAKAVARYLASFVKVKVTLTSVTNVSVNRAKVYSANRAARQRRLAAHVLPTAR